MKAVRILLQLFTFASPAVGANEGREAEIDDIREGAFSWHVDHNES